MDAARDDEVTAFDLLAAYTMGIFPMADAATDTDIFWVDPDMRGVIPLDAFHVSHSLRKFLKKRPYRVTINHAFDAVITACGEAVPKRPDTWINPTIKNWFCELHRMGFAHSVECWDHKTGALVGGLYGMAIGAAFFGESMFSKADHASKVALVHLVARLNARGFQLLDCQFTNPHLLQFGCIEISREDYHSALGAAVDVAGVSFVGADDCVSSGVAGAAGASVSGAATGAATGAAALSSALAAAGLDSSLVAGVLPAGVLASGALGAGALGAGVLACDSDWAMALGFLQSSTVTS